MRRLLHLIFLLTISIAFAKPNMTTDSQPSIGVLLGGQFVNFNQVQFTISIKNTGDETLTNITVTDLNNLINFQFGSIASLAPGEEITNLIGLLDTTCYNNSQIRVDATTVDGTIISDLSADPNNDFTAGTYFDDFFSYVYYIGTISGTQEGIYQDLNNNSLVDVGDVVNYTYVVDTHGDFMNGNIIDNNATVFNDFYSSNNYTTTGIHYLNQDDVDAGYVYNTASTMGNVCFSASQADFTDASPCSCPNPGFQAVITQLTQGPLATVAFLKSNFAIYPNPASDYIMIENKTNTDSQYQIIDINGKKLQSNTVENFRKIDIGMLDKGFYFINISSGQAKATYKLVKR